MHANGQAYFDNGLPADDVVLRFYQRRFGGGGELLGEASTGDDGKYEFAQETSLENVEVRAVGADGAEVSLTEVMCRVPEVLILVIPAAVRPLASEYQRISADLGRLVAGRALGDAQENTERRDLSLLHCSTRWDARLIALLVIADRLTVSTGVDRQALYGMLRCGLPTEAMQLARMSRTGVGHALRKANQAGIIALSDEDIEMAQERFEAFARATRRELVGPGALSSYGDMLKASGLDTAQRDAFDKIFTTHTGTTGTLWDKAKHAGLPVEPLKLTARLGYLTLNNADLVAALRGEIDKPQNLEAHLVGQQLYQPDTWISRLRAMAGGDDKVLAQLIPPAYTGKTADERLAAYSADLARKVRRSFPTQVMAHMVKTDQLVLGADHNSVKADVATVLVRAAEVPGFSVGRTPLGAFLRDHEPKLLNGMSPRRAAAAVKQVKTLHRLYQITPHDEALKVLLDNGFTSAFDVTAMPEEAFVRRFGGDKRIPVAQARTIYQKAHQVSSVITTFFAAAKQIEHPPPVHVLSPAPTVIDAAKNNLIKHYPTMERLFGSLDYGECDHCRSVLSPAAYLVDILKFLDPDQLVWDGTVAEWLADHPGEPTPDKPFDVLSKRRPDIQALPLTCENTHTALPYIDLVNEILEYFLVHEKLGPQVAYDTGGASSSDLLAEPQHLLTDAYDLLKKAPYPLTLPFDLWLQTVRRFGDHFDAPLWQLLDALRPIDGLDPTPDGYGLRAVFNERLGLSLQEYGILAFQTPTTWYGLYGYADEVTAHNELSSAKTLSRRLGVSYRELVALLKTGFVNPRLETLVELRKFGVDVEDALRYLDKPGHPPFDAGERKAFEQKLGTAGVAWLTETADDFSNILVLADVNAGGGFDSTTLRYADTTPVDPIALLTVNLLVRLWRRLGWTIEETGRVLHTFVPFEHLTLSNIGAAMQTALLGVAHYDTLSGLLKTGAKGRPALVFLWSELDDARYAELFLTGNADTRDPAFDHPLGHYLTENLALPEHLPGLRAALNLTTVEIDHILADSGQNLPTATLNLTTVSLLYRYKLLSGWLNLSITDLITLEGLSGLRPFTPLHNGTVTSIDQDHPYTQTQRFVEVAAIVQDTGLSVADLDYLLRHRFDPVGQYRSAATPPLALMRSLAVEINRIRAEHAVPTDPLAFTDELLQQKLALVFPPDVVATFLGMWQGTVEYRTAKRAVAPADALKPEAFADEPAIIVRYDQVTHIQTLTYRGVLNDAERARLMAKYSTKPAGVLLTELLDQVLPKEFFAVHLVKKAVGADETGFLSMTDFDDLFPPSPDKLDEADQHDRRAKLVEAFLPYLQDRLIRQAVIQSVATDLGTEPELAQALVAEPTLVDDPDEDGQPLLAAYTAVGEPGIDVTAGGTRLEGYLEVPTSGVYRFFVTCDEADTHVVLRFDHLTDPLLSGKASDGGAELSEYTTLRAGAPHGFTVEADKPGIGLSVQGELLPRAALTDALVTWPRGALTRLHRAHLLLAKVIQLASAFDLTEPELRHMSDHPDDFDGLDLGALPTMPGQDGEIESVQRFGWFLRLAGYVTLRGDLATRPDELVDLLLHARRTCPAGTLDAEAQVRKDLCARLARITRRDPGTVEAAADLLDMTAHATPNPDGIDVAAPDFADERGIRRLWTVLGLAARFGVAPDALGRWATPAPDAAVAQGMRDTLKARYEPERWRAVARSIFDDLRRARRDALVARIMHTKGFDRVEQLFEYFLIDPATEPVVQTSRVRTAISSVQTFVQRCQLNLEPEVSPSFINTTHWDWKRRYRVWEANRKIFLWPENWLEPEWRDDPTHLFTGLQGSLLQGDLSAERAETAFLGYLRGLEQIARLDVRAIHLEQRTDPAANVLHVVARTFGSPHRYFYRTYAHQMWTPWIPVTTDIDGDHIVVTVWRGRTHLFWVSFFEETQGRADPDMKIEDAAKQPVGKIQPPAQVKVRLSWTELFQGAWTEPVSTGFRVWGRPKIHSNGPPVFRPAEVFVHATVGDDDAVLVHLTNSPDYLDYALRVVSKHGSPSVRQESLPIAPPYTSVHTTGQGRYVSEDEGLTVSYVEQITTKDGKTTYSCATDKEILAKGENYTLVTHSSPLRGVPVDVGPVISPFFYADEQHTFYVEPKLIEETSIQHADGFPRTIPLTLSYLDDPEHWPLIAVEAQVEIGPDPVERSAAAKFAVKASTDWVTRTGNLVPFGDNLIGMNGGVTINAGKGGKG